MSRALRCFGRGRRLARWTVVAAAVMSLAACATVTRSPKDDRLLVDSRPEGAAVFLNGARVGETPVMVDAPRSDEIRVRCAKTGYRDAEAVVRREANPWTQPDDVFMAIVDTATGAAKRLQRNRLFLELAPLEP